MSGLRARQFAFACGRLPRQLYYARTRDRVSDEDAPNASRQLAVLRAPASLRDGDYHRYDELLMSRMERSEARAAVRGEVDGILAGWRGAN